MSIDRSPSRSGFSRMPFGKDLAPGTLHAHEAHGQAVARIQWCICRAHDPGGLGRAGCGEAILAARAAGAGLDESEGADGLRPMLRVLVAGRPVARARR